MRFFCLYYKRNTEACLRNHCYRGKAINNTYYECASVVLGIQHLKRMRRVILSSVACPALPHFSTLSHKRHGFRGKKLPNIKCVFWFSLQLLSETYLILRWTERDIVINIHVCVWSTRYCCHIVMTFEFSRQIFEKGPSMKFNKILLSGSRVVPSGRTDRHDEVNSLFSQLCESA